MREPWRTRGSIFWKIFRSSCSSNCTEPIGGGFSRRRSSRFAACSQLNLEPWEWLGAFGFSLLAYHETVAGEFGNLCRPASPQLRLESFGPQRFSDLLSIVQPRPITFDNTPGPSQKIPRSDPTNPVFLLSFRGYSYKISCFAVAVLHTRLLFQTDDMQCCTKQPAPRRYPDSSAASSRTGGSFT